MFEESLRRKCALNWKLLQIVSIMAFLTLIAGGCKKTRVPYSYELLDGFTGWITVEFNRTDCPALIRQNGKLILQFKNDGRICTSSTFKEGWAKDEYYYVAPSHKPRKIIDSGPESLIWGVAVGSQVIGQKERSYLTAFIGSAAQFDKAGNAPDLPKIAHDPSVAENYTYRAAAYLSNGRFNEGLADLSQAVKAQPDNITNLCNRANAYTVGGDFNNALKDFDKAVIIDPGNSLIYRGRALVFGRMRQYNQALNDWNKYIQLKPGNAEDLVDRGRLYFLLGQYESAVKDCNKALNLNPECAAAYNGLSWIKATSKDPAFLNGAEAVKLGQKACELSQMTNWSYLDTLAVAYSQIGDKENATKCWNKALALDGLSAAEKESLRESLLQKQSGSN